MIKKEQYPKILIYLLILFFSNLLTLFIFQNDPEANAPTRAEFIQVSLYGKLKTPFEAQKKVILTNSNENHSINEAYLIEEIRTDDNYSEAQMQQFVVEIPASQLDFISKYQHFHIYPYSPNFKQKQRNSYDLTF